MTRPRVSIVIVSRKRPAALRRCLTGVGQLQYSPFEVVVVADAPGRDAVATLPYSDSLKAVGFDAANISAARNLGISHAAGEVIAFIDDDAVPEPTWLHHLMAPSDGEAAAFGGFVRGRNGISFQWRASRVDRNGWSEPIEIKDNVPLVLRMTEGWAVKTEGTNMAFRRETLVALGGFDPAFRYFLDETDLNLRLGEAGLATAIAPQAEVHHGFAANEVRRADRAPDNLFEIGASWAVFQRKHLPMSERSAHWQEQRAVQRRRLLEHMIAGRLEPRDIRIKLAGLDAGYAEGLQREVGGGEVASAPLAEFQPFEAAKRRSVWMTTRPLRMRHDLEQAIERVKKGEIVSLLSLSRSSLYHKVRFTEEGVWLQSGGIFGRSERDAPLVRLMGRRAREKMEHDRVAVQRRL